MTDKQLLDMNKIQLSWTLDILRRIREICESDSTNNNKLYTIAWLTKQGLK